MMRESTGFVSYLIIFVILTLGAIAFYGTHNITQEQKEKAGEQSFKQFVPDVPSHLRIHKNPVDEQILSIICLAVLHMTMDTQDQPHKDTSKLADIIFRVALIQMQWRFNVSSDKAYIMYNEVRKGKDLYWYKPCGAPKVCWEHGSWFTNRKVLGMPTPDLPH